MTNADRKRWDDRYRQAATPVEPRSPTALEMSGIELPPTGRALDVACGPGATSVWLAQQGFVVSGIDVSPVAISAAAELAGRHATTGSATFEVSDLDDGLPAGVFDLVVCQRFRNPVLYPSFAAAVAPAGLLVITVLSIVEHEGAPGPFRAAPGELVEAFAAVLEFLWSSEANGEAHLVARRPS